jgi:hypothetical protein
MEIKIRVSFNFPSLLLHFSFTSPTSPSRGRVRGGEIPSFFLLSFLSSSLLLCESADSLPSFPHRREEVVKILSFLFLLLLMRSSKKARKRRWLEKKEKRRKSEKRRRKREEERERVSFLLLCSFLPSPLFSALSLESEG